MDDSDLTQTIVSGLVKQTVVSEIKRHLGPRDQLHASAAAIFGRTNTLGL
jgi:hypothetical protein